MEIKIAGLDYRSAALDVRGKFSFTANERAELLRSLVPSAAVEAVLISTCNRTELAVVSDGEPAEMLHEARGCGSFFTLRGEAAVRRVFELAAGLCSQIPLEDQILGQMKEALAASRAERACGPLLSQLFQRAVTAGKEIRTKYKTMPHECSAAEAAVAAAAAGFGTLRGINALIVGSGEMGMLAAQLLRDRGASVRMTRRRVRRDGALPPTGVELISYDERYAAMSVARLVICATASPHFVLKEAEFQDDGRERMLIDLAVPRDIEPAFARRASVTLIDMDGLGQSALPDDFLRDLSRGLEGRVASFSEWRQVHECMPYINDVCAFAERELAMELGCEGDERDRLCEASRRMMNKLLFTLKERVDMDMAKDCYRALAKAARK